MKIKTFENYKSKINFRVNVHTICLYSPFIEDYQRQFLFTLDKGDLKYSYKKHY